jgi:CheY-like chemotaxis protein
MITCIAIDDEPLALKIIEEYCSKISFLQLVQTFSDTDAALSYLKENKVDALFLDIQMPDITGIEFYKNLPNKPMVVFKTAYKYFAVEVFNADFRTRQGVGNGKVAQQEQQGFLPRGYISGVYAIEEWRVDKGDYVKLRELSLSYNLGKVAFANNLSINFSGRNLLSWDKYNGYDPEVNSGGQSTILRGIDFGATPIPRTFSFGIKADF